MFVNVKDAPFSAVGDGVADDTAAINAAKTAANGRQIYLPSGVYRTTADLSDTAYPAFEAISNGSVHNLFSPSVRYVGDGPRRTTILADYNGDIAKGAIIRFDTNASRTYGINSGVSQLSITQVAGRTGLNGIQLTASWFNKQENVEIYGLSGSGLIASLRPDISPGLSDPYQAFSVLNRQLWIHNNSGWGVKFDAGQSPGIYTLENSYLVFNAGGGILSTTGQCRIVGNCIQANGSAGGNGGLLFDTAEGPSMVADVRQNEFDTNFSYHIWLKRVQNGNFAQNRFLSNSYTDTTGWTNGNGAAGTFMRPGGQVLVGYGDANEAVNVKFERNMHRAPAGPVPVYGYIQYVGVGTHNNHFIHNDFTQTGTGMIPYTNFTPADSEIINP